MANYCTNKKWTIFLVFSMCSLFVTSCKNTGSHKYINHNFRVQTKIDNNNSLSIVNADSIEFATKEIHEKLSLKEHRVYYVDFSWSMISKDNRDIDGTGKTLLSVVKDSLKQSIRNIQGENVCIEIIPFLDNALWNKGKPNDVFRIIKKTDFNISELKKMDAFIDNINAKKKPNGSHFNTHHSIAINDFIKNRINDDTQYHMMILLTDGKDESSKDGLRSGVEILANEWPKTDNKYVFGVFVNLMKNRKISGDLPNCFMGATNNSLHRFYKQGLNFDFNVFLLQPKDTIEHRTYNIASIPIGGCIPMFEPTIQQDEHYMYTILEQPSQNSTCIKIRIDTITSACVRPNIHVGKLSYKYVFSKTENNANSEFFTSGNTIELTIIDEKTPNIKFIFPSNKKDSIPCLTQRLEYCKKLFGIAPEWSDTVTICIPYEKSFDAKFKKDFNKLKLSITKIPEYAELLSPKMLYLDQPSDTVLITFALNPRHENLNKNNKFEGEIKVENADKLHAIFVNGFPLDNIESSNIIGKCEIVVNKCWHPLLILLILLLILCLLIIVSVLLYRETLPRFTHRLPCVQFGTLPKNAHNRNLDLSDFSFEKHGYLDKPIQYIRLDTSVKADIHKTWGVHNFWNLKRAIHGDIHVHPLGRNIFAQRIEFRPTVEGVEICVDSQMKYTFKSLNESQKLVTSGSVALEAYFCQQARNAANINIVND